MTLDHPAARWSPYLAPGDAGRTEVASRELLTIRDHCDRLQTFGAGRGTLVVFHGARGSGKSTLMQTAAEQAHRAGLLAVHARASPSFDLCDDLALFLEVALTTRRLRDCEQHVYEDCRARQVAPLLHLAGLAALSGGRRGLALFLDDLDLAEDEALHALLEAVDTLESTSPRAPVLVVASGSHDVLERLDELGTPRSGVDLHEIADLDDAAVARALQRPVAGHGVRWAGDAAWLVAGLTGGSPRLVQLLAHETWVGARPRRGGVLGPADVRRGLRRAVELLECEAIRRLDRSTDDQLRYLDRLARATSHGDGRLGPREVAVLEDMLADVVLDVRRTRRELDRLGLVRGDARGALTFGAPTLHAVPHDDDLRRAVALRAARRGLVDAVTEL